MFVVEGKRRERRGSCRGTDWLLKTITHQRGCGGKNLRFLIFVFAFAFFLSFYICVDFRVPLADPWARLAPFRIHFGAICGQPFPRFPPPALNSCRDFARNFARNLQRTSKELTRNAKHLQRTSKKLMQRTFPKVKSQAAYSILRRNSNRNKPPAIKEGAAVLTLAHSD